MGNSGTILHYDGNTWNTMTNLTTGNHCGVWGSSGSDVFAIGSPERSGNAIFPAENDIILHYDGNSWSGEFNSTRSPNGIWGSSSSNVFVVGYPGIFVRCEGSGWRPMEIPVGTRTASLSSVWGTSDSDVFAVGSSGTILHYDDRAWSAMTSGSSNSLEGVWGSSSSDVFAVGYDGTILHYAG